MWRDSRAAHDDYSSIILKGSGGPARRGVAERMHERARREFWATLRTSGWPADDLIREAYRGIRPPRAIPRVRTTPRRPRFGSCSTPRMRRESVSPNRLPCIRPPRSADSTSLIRSPIISGGPDRPGPGRELRAPQGHAAGRGGALAGAGSGLRPGEAARRPFRRGRPRARRRSHHPGVHTGSSSDLASGVKVFGPVAVMYSNPPGVPRIPREGRFPAHPRSTCRREEASSHRAPDRAAHGRQADSVARAMREARQLVARAPALAFVEAAHGVVDGTHRDANFAVSSAISCPRSRCSTP